MTKQHQSNQLEDRMQLKHLNYGLETGLFSMAIILKRLTQLLYESTSQNMLEQQKKCIT